jgi:NAD(P)-dependent dehydrogenase (short-subunit alcohol dehydrogenase family)
MSLSRHMEKTAPSLFSLHGKVVVLTGAAGGFGRELALGFAQTGASLALLDQNPGGIEVVAALIQSRCPGSPSFNRPLDVADEGQVRSAVAEVHQQLGRIDVLVHVAGAARLAPLADMATADFDYTLASHLRGTFLMVREVGRLMRRQGGGSIVLMSSIASQCALGRGTAAYAAAKAGVNALVRELAVEWAPDRVRVNAVAPCQFRTPGLKSRLADAQFNPDGSLEARMIAAIPAGRLGEPEEIVGPCLFLASAAASMVTGHVLFVDGGYTAR